MGCATSSLQLQVQNLSGDAPSRRSRMRTLPLKQLPHLCSHPVLLCNTPSGAECAHQQADTGSAASVPHPSKCLTRIQSSVLGYQVVLHLTRERRISSSLTLQILLLRISPRCQTPSVRPFQKARFVTSLRLPCRRSRVGRLPPACQRSRA